MENEASELDLICRRQRRFRSEAIRQIVDVRRSKLSEAGNAVPEGEKIRRDLSLRILRALGSSGSESK